MVIDFLTFVLLTLEMDKQFVQMWAKDPRQRWLQRG